jgi:hypothetical protein
MASQLNTKEGREWTLSVLREREMTIFFTKKDGSERKMVCTLLESQIPDEKLPKNTGIAKNDEVCPVFDVENQDWRSFRWDSVTKIQFDLK